MLRVFFIVLAVCSFAFAKVALVEKAVPSIKSMTYLGQVSSSLKRSGLSNLYVSNHYSDFFDAVQYCSSNGVDGKLVSVLTHAQDEDIKIALLKREPSYFWTSGIFNPAISSFVWYTANNALISGGYTNWCGDFPPADPQPNDCVYISSDLFNYCWYTLPCNTPLFFLCEMPV